MPSLRTLRSIAAASLLALTAPGALAQPFNDECDLAQPAVEGLNFFDLTDATHSRTGTCDPSGSGAAGDIWFDYTAAATGQATITTCGYLAAIPGYPVTLTVYSSCGGPQVACAGSNCTNGQSTLTLSVLAGHHYLVRLARTHVTDPDTLLPGGILGIRLAANCTHANPAPSNDCCSDATSNNSTGTFTYTTVNATRDYWSDADLDSDSNPDVWIDFRAPFAGFAKIRPADPATNTDAGPRDVSISVFDGSCSGAQITCDCDTLASPDDTRQVVFATTFHHHYLIRLRSVSSDADHSDPNGPAPVPEITGKVTISQAFAPANDECTTATTLPLQTGHPDGTGIFAYDNTLATNSGPDNQLSCTSTFGLGEKGIYQDVWFRWTSHLPAGQDAVITTIDGPQILTKIAVYANHCPVSEPLDCNNQRTDLLPYSTIVFTPTPNTTYLIRVGHITNIDNQPAPVGRPGQFTIMSTPTCVLTPPAGAIIEPDSCTQDTNGLCDGPAPDGTRNFALATDIPCGTSTHFGTAPVFASADGQSSVWDDDYYKLVLPVPSHVSLTGQAEFPMILRMYEESSLDTGQCFIPFRYALGTPLPIFSLCAEPDLYETDLDAGTYYILVHNTRFLSPCPGKNNYVFTVNVSDCEPRGRCCMGASPCQVLPHSVCLSSGGAYAGDGTTCPPPGGNYLPAACGAALEDISGTGTPHTPGPACDDCGVVANLGFTFNFYGQDYTSVHVSSNGFLTFSDDMYDGFTPPIVPLPNPFVLGVVAPCWVDLDASPGHGEIFTATLGSAPNRRFVAMWKNVESVGVPGSSSTFEAILLETSNTIAFRYGALDASATPVVAVSNADGSVAAVFDPASLGTCSTLSLHVQLNPCCRADFNIDGHVSVNDIFDFLNAWFAGDPRADVNGAGGITVQDIFDFLNAWFAGC